MSKKANHIPCSPLRSEPWKRKKKQMQDEKKQQQLDRENADIDRMFQNYCRLSDQLKGGI